MSKTFDHFLFNADARQWLRVFRLLLYPYLVWICWNYNWTAYSAMSSMFKAPGLSALLLDSFPSLRLIRVIQLSVTAAALDVICGRAHLASSIIVFAGSLTLDCLHNGFGFVNAQIHVIWFSAAMIFATKDKENCSLIFRFCELIVVLAYIQSGLNKVLIGGLAWLTEGTTLQIALVRQGQDAGQWLAQQSPFMPVLASASVALELAFLLYYQIKPARKFLLASAVMFHLGTLILLGIDFFHLWIFAASVAISSLISKYQRRANG